MGLFHRPIKECPNVLHVMPDRRVFDPASLMMFDKALDVFFRDCVHRRFWLEERQYESSMASTLVTVFGSRPITSKSANSFEARHPQGESRPWAAASRRYLL